MITASITKLYETKPENGTRQKIIIADDAELNRAILKDILREDFDILEAENGLQVIEYLKEQSSEISAILLDMVMPGMNGFEVLAVMNKYNWIRSVPVVMIAAKSLSSHINRAFELGVTEYIQRPFQAAVVRRRVINTVMLYTRNKRLVDLIEDEIYEREKNHSLLISLLSHIVEFRNGENGLHVMRVNMITEMLLKELTVRSEKYDLSQEEQSMIVMASSLHDIGKIGIEEDILNKPGRLTKEEFEKIKMHSGIGASLLEKLPYNKEEKIVKYAYEICRWHHERYDGAGYPDGLVGDEIPITAQIVGLADIYETLTSERVYKPPFSHGQTIRMILEGECGAFNPLLLECLKECADRLEKEATIGSITENNRRQIRRRAEDQLSNAAEEMVDMVVRPLTEEEYGMESITEFMGEVHFEYSNELGIMKISPEGASIFGIPELITDAELYGMLDTVVNEELREEFTEEMKNTSPEYPVIQVEMNLKTKEGKRRYKIIARTVWSEEETPKCTGIAGAAIDIHREHHQKAILDKLSSLDPLTGLWNREASKKQIMEKLREDRDHNYAILLFDVDFFKLANDTYGHAFGDSVLKHIAKTMKNILRSTDMAVRAGGDEFMVFLEYNARVDLAAERIFRSLIGKFDHFPISVSMGISTSEVCSKSYHEMFECADRALYHAKKAGRGKYIFFDESMEETFSVISPIESGK